MHDQGFTGDPRRGPQKGEGHGERHRGHHGRGHGHGEGFGPGFGGFGRGFGPFGRGRGRGQWGRARRGDVRTAILLALASEPMHGYQIMQRLEERSGGAWRPSPGSVYPTLQLLEDQGLVKGEEAAGRRVFSLTETGQAEADKLKERLGDVLWDESEEMHPLIALRQEFASLAGAFKQIAAMGTPDDVQKSIEILRDARRRIYALLADAE